MSSSPSNAMNPPQADRDAARPAFSVIMPVYNHAAYLDEAIESVRTQSVQNWQLLVVDDGSTDESFGIAQAHAAEDNRIVALRQENAGPAAARNLGARHAKADWLTFLDSDDIWYPTALATYAEAQQRQPDVEFFYGTRDRLDADGSITKLSGEFQDAPTTPVNLFGRMFLSTMVVCVSRRLFEAAGGFYDRLRSCEDYELFLRIGLHTAFHPMAVALGLRRRHDSNLSRQSGFSRLQEAEILRHFAEHHGAEVGLEGGRVARRLGHLYYSSAKQYLKERCAHQSIASAKASLRQRFSAKTLGILIAATLLLPLGRTNPRTVPPLR